MITGVYLPRQSWEKASHWKLSNGFTCVIQYGHYGELITCMESPDGQKWHACNGHLSADRKDFNQTAADGDWTKFPPELEFARDWIEPTSPGHWQTIMRPKFKREYPTK